MPFRYFFWMFLVQRKYFFSFHKIFPDESELVWCTSMQYTYIQCNICICNCIFVFVCLFVFKSYSMMKASMYVAPGALTFNAKGQISG